ncbi:hypothetical protein ACIBQ1_36770 [Nonomuraea sp. NPDC050153]|uniref:hypothetical protein n=1 Tax=Nonomuraea sp. NPDC050153 TaxID=3364359 RepID=UPI0037A04A10
MERMRRRVSIPKLREDDETKVSSLCEERVEVRRDIGDLYPMIIGLCRICGRRRMYNTAIAGPPARCSCTQEEASEKKKEMLFIDKLEPLLATLPYIDPVLDAQRGAKYLPYYACGIDAQHGERVFINLGRLPLGDESPTYIYLIDFPDWHGEAFIKVGIGLAERLRAHERYGGVVLQAIEVPRWQAYAIERRILAEWPSFYPATPLPQNGDTECLVRAIASQIQLSRYVSLFSEGMTE